MMTEKDFIVPIGGKVLAAEETGITDELGRAGLGFGDVIKRVGVAVAETQNKLNETSAQTTSALSTETIEVIAARRRVFDNDGTLRDEEPIMQKLPLLNFVDPVFYQFTKARLQGLFVAREFSNEATTTVTTDINAKTGFNINLSIGRKRRLGKIDAEVNNTSTTQVTADSTSDVSFGSIRTNFLLEPAPGVILPKPSQIIRGPRFTLVASQPVDEKDQEDLVARTMEVVIGFFKRDGTPIEGQEIEVESGGLSWAPEPISGSTKTDANGETTIKLRRDFNGNPDTAFKDFTITARKGLVYSNTIVSL